MEIALDIRIGVRVLFLARSSLSRGGMNIPPFTRITHRISQAPLHHLRNTFQKPIYMSKRIQTKIQAKHPDSFCYTDRVTFSQLQKCTIAYLPYPKSNDTFNFIAYIPESAVFVLYALKSEKRHTNCITIFKLRESTLKKYYSNENFVLMRSEYKKVIEGYIN